MISISYVLVKCLSSSLKHTMSKFVEYNHFIVKYLTAVLLLIILHKT